MRLAVAAFALAACSGGGNTESFKREGRILIEQGTESPGTFVNAGAVFTDGLAWGMPVASDGPCTLYTSDGIGSFSAGQIDVVGGTTRITLVSSDLGVGVVYATNNPPTYPLFADGATLSASAAGGNAPTDLPGFDLQAAAPAPVTGFTTPAMLSRSGGATVTWDGGNNSLNWVIVVIEALNPISGFQQIVCDASDSGTFTLPASTLALIPKTGADSAFVMVSHVHVTSRIVSDTRVELDLVESAESSVLAIGP